jgi:hypothetical protein
MTAIQDKIANFSAKIFFKNINIDPGKKNVVKWLFVEI